MDTIEKIKNIVDSNPIVVFMKGTPQFPQCGFSMRTVEALKACGVEFHHVDVLAEPEIRQFLPRYSEWPTFPQVFINGELVGGCDIVLGMFNSGELHGALGMEQPDRTPPEITITDDAAERIREAVEGHEGIRLHFQVDANWNAQLNLAPPQGGEIVASTNGIDVLMDIATAQRARGATIDWVESIHGDGLGVELPQAPPPVNQLSVQQLKEKLGSEDLVLVDVRTPDERAKAVIEPSVLLDKETLARLEALPKDSELAFYCHTGGRSLGAAEHFRKIGFTNVSNVAGGIDAWSKEIDPEVPQY
jgi:monothiol glutaredoxin